MCDVEYDFHRYIKSDYDHTFNDLWEDYNTIPFNEFYSNIRNLRGKYGEIVSLRNEYLNVPRNEYNEKEQKRGKKLCSPKQIKMFAERKKAHINNIAEIQREFVDDEYTKFLEERGLM